MQLFVYTRISENYGAHEWDGEGECPQYWKPKGGETYKVRSSMIAAGLLTETVMAVRSQIETDSQYLTETIVDWEVVRDDELTEFERDQLEHEGSIRFPAKIIVV
jgi:hypothetical protein